MNILGVETSCDETAAAVVRDGALIRSNVISSQIDLHRAYGGVVPELASRSHLRMIDGVITQALAEAQAGYDEIDAVAATYGPGLATSLLVGFNAAKGIAFTLGKPLVAINHLEAHLYSPVLLGNDAVNSVGRAGPTRPRAAEECSSELGNAEHPSLPAKSAASFTTARWASAPYPLSPPPTASARFSGSGTGSVPADGQVERSPDVAADHTADLSCFPLVSLIISGGHTILVHATAVGRHEILGETVDDAAGEAFDKVAKLLGLRYPGGPEIDRLARTGNPAAIAFPRSMLGDPSDNFSFSGLKTAVLYYLRKNPHPQIADVCASFQEAVVDVLVGKLMRAAAARGVHTVSASGGVSINSRFRERLGAACGRAGYRLLLVPPSLCTDNAAMIAALACFKMTEDHSGDWARDVAPSIGLGMD